MSSTSDHKPQYTNYWAFGCAISFGVFGFLGRHVKALKIVNTKRATKTAALMAVKSMMAE
jgi:hypothetical protein